VNDTVKDIASDAVITPLSPSVTPAAAADIPEITQPTTLLTQKMVTTPPLVAHSSSGYNEDIHFPIMLELRRKKE
jgi:hypothetical protein